MRTVVGCLFVLTACSFGVSGAGAPGDGAGDDGNAIDASGIDPPWWDDGWARRRQLVVTTGPTTPDKGYAGYTVRYAGDPAELTGLHANCDDLRVVVWDGTTWAELPRHVQACSSTVDVRFALPRDLADGETWRDAYLYYAHPTPPAPAAASGTSVYLWWDPATADLGGSYTRGRMDQWLSTGHDDSLQWNPGGYYSYDTGDDSQSGYRRSVDERDVLIEASWFHTGCYPFNMQSGMCARGIVASGSGGSELATHYYCTSRAQNPTCANNDQGLYDGDIVDEDNEIIALQGLTDPPPIVPGQWRTQALAAFGVAPTQLRFWDADAAWPALAMPPTSALQASGPAAHEHPSRGFAGIMTAQDIGQIRDVVIRRYVEPEPVVTVETEATQPP